MGKTFWRLVGRASAALAAVLIATPTFAEAAVTQAPTPDSGSSKAEAILGAPSRLAIILAEQQAVTAAAPVQTAKLKAGSFFRQRANNRRPDVFGSVALGVRRTPLDHRWRHVARHRVEGTGAAFAARLRSRAELDRVEAVNRYVNGRVRFVDDSRQYGREDVWASASDTLRRRRGDCEDYAIAKLQMLRAAGIGDRDLYLVIARDLIRRADHALLVVRVGDRLVALDNGTDRILDADDTSDYRPVLTFSVNRAWTHGYRVVPPMMMAAVTLAPPLR